MDSGAPKEVGFRGVKAAILQRITDETWPPGSLIPGEVDLVREFGCARATISRAMREIADLGLVERRRRAGTRVRQTPKRQARFEIPLVRDEVEATGAAYRYALVRRDLGPAPDWLRARMGLAPDAQVLHLRCMHHADGVPFQFEDRWISLSALPEAADQDFAVQGPNEWLIATVPYSQAEISFLAEAADAEVAGHLGMAEGEPVFRVERTTWWQGAAVTHVRLSYRKGHRMTTRY